MDGADGVDGAESGNLPISAAGDPPPAAPFRARDERQMVRLGEIRYQDRENAR